MAAPTPDSATEVGSIGSRNETAAHNAPVPESVLDEKQNDNKHVDKTPEEKPQVEDAVKRESETDEDDGIEYPAAWKLVLITIALCLSVFCVALVRFSTFTLFNQTSKNSLDFFSILLLYKAYALHHSNVYILI